MPSENFQNWLKKQDEEAIHIKSLKNKQICLKK